MNLKYFHLGLVVHCGAFFVIGFLIFHLSHLLHTLTNPFRAQILLKSVRYTRTAHIAETLTVLICGSLPSIVLFSTSGYGYSGFPPLCYSKNPATLFYTLILPISIGSTIILCLLLASIWVLLVHKVTQSWNNNNVYLIIHAVPLPYSSGACIIAYTFCVHTKPCTLGQVGKYLL